MVPSQIFPVKLVFGVKIKLAAILTGSKYHLTGANRVAGGLIQVNLRLSRHNWELVSNLQCNQPKNVN